MIARLVKIGIALALLIMVLNGVALADSFARKIIIRVDQAESAWSQPQIEQILAADISRNEQLRPVLAEPGQDNLPPFPTNRFDTDSLVNWGREVGGRYLLLVDVNSERLERRKSWHIPLVFHKYSTVGVIEGELRLIDLSWGRVITAEPFKISKEAKRIMQMSMDDNINDPEIHVSAPDKQIFFHELEQKLCRRITEHLEQATVGEEG
ncbi:MAG TPA: hypothetical protein PLF13_00700 [candidate division Zixibacteria bacterium]|nr:hypothetical protein [candidate division Zixibacteria bacterium]